MNLPKVVGVLRADTPELALEMARAAIRGGLEALEITCTVPNAASVIQTLNLEQSTCLVGAGTVLNTIQAKAVLEAGASFLVSPHFGLDVLKTAREARISYIPGVFTPTEIVTALNAGCEIVKIFPITRAGGVAYLRDLLAPLPHLKAMVTGGVKSSEVRVYLEAGALAVGLGDIFIGTPEEIEIQTRALVTTL